MKNKKTIKKLRSDDIGSFNGLYNTYSKKIYTLAYKMTGSKEEADDIIQDTFLKALQNIKKFKGKSHIYTWLYKIAKNICYQYMKNRERSSFQYMEDLIYSASDMKGYNSSNEFEKQYYITQVKDGCLNGLLKCLSLDQRSAFIYHVLLGISIYTTADILDKSQNSVKVLIHRARKNLKKFLCENCSLYDKKNPCRCENLINFSLKQKWIKKPDKKDLKNIEIYDSNFIEKEIYDIKKITSLYHSLPDKMPAGILKQKIRHAIQNKKFSILQ